MAWAPRAALPRCLAVRAQRAGAPTRRTPLRPVRFGVSTYSFWQFRAEPAPIETCIDESIEDLLVQPDDDAQCTDPSYRRDGDRIVFEATCRVEGSVARISGTFTGDFARSYQGQINTTYAPPLHGMDATDMTMDARWVSACRPGQQPGDVEMTGMPSIPGMGEIDLQELMKNLPQMQR